MDFYCSEKCGLSLFSFWFVNFFFPEPKRKRSRAAFSNSWNRNLAMFGSKKTRAVLSLLTFLSRPKDTDAAAPQVNVRRKMRFAYLCRACSMGKKTDLSPTTYSYNKYN